MLPLSEELRQAIAELRTWAALHRANNEPGIATALAVVEKGAAFIARAERMHPHSPAVLPDVGPSDVLVFHTGDPDPDPEMAEAIFDFYAARAREAGAPAEDPVWMHAPLLIWLAPDAQVEKLDPMAMESAGWIRKP